MKKVLLVDDEKFFLENLALSVTDLGKTHGFEVLTASDGQTALRMIESQNIDLLVTDVQMPKVTGLELLAYVSRSCPMTSVVIMTAFGTQDVRRRVAVSGRGTYVEKPIDLEKFEQVLLRELNAKRGHVEGISLATFLQIVAAENMACTLSVSSQNRLGTLYCRGGNIVHAETDGLSGLDAALDIAVWPDTSVDIRTVCNPSEQTVDLPIAHLLLEAFRLQDEAQRHGDASGEEALVFSEQSFQAPTTESERDSNVQDKASPAQTGRVQVYPPPDQVLGVGRDTQPDDGNHTKEVRNMATEKQINAILEKLDRIEGSYGGTLMSGDGMVIATRLDKKFAADKVGAMSSDVIRLATKVIAEAQFGSLDNMVIEGTDGKLCLINASRGGFFITIIGDRSLNLGMARMTLQDAMAEFDKLV